jgi:hypothetical protein
LVKISQKSNHPHGDSQGKDAFKAVARSHHHLLPADLLSPASKWGTGAAHGQMAKEEALGGRAPTSVP